MLRKKTYGRCASAKAVLSLSSVAAIETGCNGMKMAPVTGI